MVVVHSTSRPRESDVLGFVNGGGVGRELSFSRILRLVLQGDVVILHGYYLPWTGPVAVLARLGGAQIFLVPHGSLTRYQQQTSRLRKAIFDKTLGFVIRSAVNAFVLGSVVESDQLKQKFKRARTWVTGIGVNGFDVQPGRNEHTDTLHILSMSRITAKKRIDLCILALAELRNRGVDAMLTIAGGGSREILEELEAIARATGFHDSIFFIGEVRDNRKEVLLRASDIFLAPSDDENFGIAPAEALSAGVACVCSPFVASVMGLGFPAGVIAPQEPESMADAIEALAAVPVGVRFQAARKFADSHYRWSRVTDQWMDLIGSSGTDLSVS